MSENISDRDIIESYRQVYPRKCVNCAHCKIELTDEERWDKKIEPGHTDLCTRYPPHPDSRFPEVVILEDRCGEMTPRQLRPITAIPITLGSAKGTENRVVDKLQGTIK